MRTLVFALFQVGHDAVNDMCLGCEDVYGVDIAICLATVRDLLTSYVADMGIDPLPHLAALDQARAMELIR